MGLVTKERLREGERHQNRFGWWNWVAEGKVYGMGGDGNYTKNS